MGRSKELKGAASIQQTIKNGKICDAIYAKQIRQWIESGMKKT